MTPKQVQVHFKAANPSDLARKLDKPISTVWDWFQRGVVPKAVQYELQIETEGALKAAVKQ